MPKVQLVVAPRPLAGFRRKALASPVEVLAFLVGKANYRKGRLAKIIINEFVYPPQTATDLRVEYDVDCIEDINDFYTPEMVIGTIHSHPFDGELLPAEPSQTDVRSSSKYGEIVFGIMSIGRNEKSGKRKRSEVAWYLGTPEIEVVDG